MGLAENAWQKTADKITFIVTESGFRPISSHVYKMAMETDM